MAEPKRILLIGGGGHCRSVLDCLLSSSEFDEIGIIDIDQSACALGVPVVGCDADLPRLKLEGWTHAFVSVGSVGSTALRRRLYGIVKKLGFTLPPIIDPSAQIAGDAEIGEGVFIGKRAVVNTGSRIGACAIINTASIIEHDCVVGEFCHISPGAILCGQVSAGADAHLGAGSVVRQGLTIGSGSVIGMGSVVVKNVPDNVKAYGNPCRVVG